MTESPRPHMIVVKGGWLTTVQDLGRYGHQQYGVPVCGVMDSFAAIVANRLVGNPDHAAVLELTLNGPELQFERDTVLAITGADLSPTIQGHSLPLWQSFVIPRGSRLAFGRPQSGSRAYLAIAGGIDVPLVLGSRSTHCASETGGFRGRPLKAGDTLYGRRSNNFIDHVISKRLSDQLIPRYEQSVTLRIILGPQQDCFRKRTFDTLTASTYSVSPQSDRMGYRLTGPKLIRKGSAHCISDGTTTGALQVPPDGEPILLMADRQTTGGYPKIAVVISTDLPRAAQLTPRNTITFETCTVKQAQALLRQHRALLDAALPQQQ